MNNKFQQNENGNFKDLQYQVDVYDGNGLVLAAEWRMARGIDFIEN
ncbi:hypothetical protein MM213_12650 [Belliella sp. R4-6]|uniref:Uncharacterized protein n=1 Tax=Belliella alkalica TaxID=1730871 RepID=A0ABS9VEG1_9BACT|nr:hypothetical protein [Belliella alkalica]MCH7414340.1 hypothetical protein [Belliella alkalica]